MGAAKRFNRILHNEINVHAAWLPVTNTFDLGDYGVISDGVFTRVGHIKEFGAEFAVRPGSPTSINFTSEQTRIIRFVANAEVEVLPGEDLEAKLKIEFKRENSFLIKAKTLDLLEMENIAQLARTLNDARGWRGKYRVVSAKYTGANCVILSSRKADSIVEITGNASALKEFELGAVSAELGFSSEKELGLEIVGATGVVGLGLFKLGWRGRPKVLGPDDDVPIETGKDWGADLEDDV